MNRFAVRTLVVALALAAGTASAQSYYDGDDAGYAYGDQYAQQDAGYYDAQDQGYYDAQQPAYYDGQDSGYYDNGAANGYAQGPAYSDGREAYAAEGAAYDTARVISVDPMVQPGQPVQRQVCDSAPVQAYASNGNYAVPRRTSGGGAVIGAILGGVIGNTLAKDSGHHGGYYGRGYGGGYHNNNNREAATVVGAVIGGVVGNGIERSNQAAYYGPNGGQYAQRQVQRCRVVTDYQDEERVVGYRVGYEYAGRRFETVTDYHPGSEIRVRVQVTPDL